MIIVVMIVMLTLLAFLTWVDYCKSGSKTVLAAESAIWVITLCCMLAMIKLC